MEDSKVKEVVEKLFNDDRNPTQQMLERIWFRNILYYMGEQWFEWAKSSTTFKRVMPNPDVPTPVSNMIRDYVRSMKSLILNKDFKVSIWPNSNDQDDREAAEMGENFLRWLETTNDEAHLDEKEKEVTMMVLCGTSFDRTFPEMPSDVWMFDKSGNPIGKSDITSENLSPFTVRLDHYGETLRAKRFVGIKSLKPKEWVEDTFKIKVNDSDVNDGPVINYEKKLARLVSNVSPWKGDGLEMASSDGFEDEDLVLFKEIEFKPTKADPNGVYAAMVGDQICFNHSRLPVPVDTDGRWYYTLTDFHYYYVPGRYWSDSGVNDLISPQNSINQIDQDLETNRKGVGRPLVLIPTDVNMQRITKYGQSILAIKYDALTSGGQRPEIERGTSLPSQVLNERDIHRMVSQEAAGDPKNVLRGQAPSAQASGIMVDILRDAAEQGHLPDIERYYRGLKRVKRKQLILAQEVISEERMIKIPDRGQKSKVVAFKGADLRNNTDVRLELASGAANSHAGQTQILLKLTESGFFSSQSDLDPEYRQDILRRLGLSGFKDKRNVDLERALSENYHIGNSTDEDLEIAHVPIPPSPAEPDGMIEIPIIPGIFLSLGPVTPAEAPPEEQAAEEQPPGVPMPGPMPPPPEEEPEPIVISDDPLFKYDEHAIHYETHRRFILSSEFRHLDPGVQEVAIAHCDIHKGMMDIQMKEELEKQAYIQGNAQRIGAEASAPAMTEVMPEGGPAGAPV